MLKILAASAAISLSIAGAAYPGEWSRTSTVVGPHGGTTTTNLNRNCVPGACSFNSTTTGPYGGVTTRTGSATRTAPGEWSYQRNGTGPTGRTWHRSGTVRFSR